ncbi:MAG: hypothetical protein ACF8GE_04860 [Phycisphaerales bacterium JB043]
MASPKTIPDAQRLVRTIGADDAGRLRLRRQWVIQPSSTPNTHGWAQSELGHDLVLRHHPDTIVRRWESAGDAIWLIGVAMGESGSPDFSEPTSRSHDAVTQALDQLAGMYVLVRVDEQDVHCYTDPAAMMGLYVKEQSVSSTPTLLETLERDESIANEYTLGGCDDWYTGRTTPFVGVHCVLANHCYSIRTGSERRFWPRESFGGMSHDEGVRAIASHFRGLLQALASEHPLLVSLTGGRDSRINLASCRDVLDRVSAFTLRGEGVHPRDVAIPERLAERFGFRHELVDLEQTPEWLDAIYDEMTSGLVIGSRRRVLGACRHLCSDDAIHVNGNLGATALGFFWDSPQPARVREESLLKEFVQKPGCIREGVRQWLDSVPDMAPGAIYNLMYFEQRGGRWMGPGETASQIFYNSFSPFCSREFFRVLSSMPVPSQRGATVLRQIVAESWPELLCEPYCSGTSLIGRAVPKRLKMMLKGLRHHG